MGGQAGDQSRLGGVGERSARHQRLLALFDQHQGKGLEIGPLFDPVVHRPGADIRYVDVHSGPELKAYYSAHPDVPVEDIVDPDFVLIGPDGTRSLPEAVGGTACFDWVVASHVIEHVPDLISWLEEVAAVLVDGGRLVLAVPDRRFSFDADRDPTTVGQILLARRLRDTIPSVRAIYDHYSRVVTIDAGQAWDGRRPSARDRIHGQDYVQEQLRLATEEGRYVDAHVWLFTPQSFVDQLGELAGLGLHCFAVEQVIPTAERELEFYAVLRRTPRGVDPAQQSEANSTSAVPSDLDARPAHGDTAGSALATGLGGKPLSPRELRVIAAKRSTMQRLRRALGRVAAGRH